MNSRAAKLFFLGFLTLFLELVLIRFLTGNIWNLGYFPNLVLLAVFLGMGIGFSTHQRFSDERSGIWFRRSTYVLLALVIFSTVGRPTLPGFGGDSGEFGAELFFTARASNTFLFNMATLAFWFLATLVIFVLISQRTAKVFREFEPLKAYTLDILGSCAGILVFMVISFWHIPAWSWMMALIPLFLVAGEREWRTRASVFCIVACALFAYGHDLKLFMRNPSDVKAIDVTWSPYQKIKYLDTTSRSRDVFANSIPHQQMLPLEEIQKLFYQLPYNERAKRSELPPYRRVLVLGAGSGNDVAAALANGAELVDAVEIDPAIAALGKKYHPAQPYSDRRVRVTVDDGRAFMVRSREKYDLIVFALTDSLAKVSSLGQLRLENYLFTEEAISRAKSLLSDDGDLLFYNFYRRAWLTEKIERMLFKGSGIYPVRLWEDADFAVLAAGRHNQRDLNTVQKSSMPIPTDDWPFLYLRERQIPGVYLGAMAGVILLLTAFMAFLTREAAKWGEKGGDLATKLAFTFMGIAFLLLETKSIIQFALLFGTTWVNSSLVFLGVLLLVLAANWTATAMKKSAMPVLFLLLMASCLVPFVIPLSTLLAIDSLFWRYVAAVWMTFLPIFFANLIFSLNFRDQKVAEHIFGWNLLGAGLGGVIEYTSLALGYQTLAIVVIVCYALVFGLLTVSRSSVKVPTPALAN